MLGRLFRRHTHTAQDLRDLQSPNGHLRERGLRRLAELRQPPDLDALRAVLQRLNDWVPPVRAAAESALLAWWPQLSPRALLACLDTLEAVSRGQRADQRWLQRLRDRLTAADDPDAFARLQALVLGRTQAAFAWQLLRQCGAVPEAELLTLGLRSGNAWVASQAARGLSHWWADGCGYADEVDQKAAEDGAYHPYLTLLAQALAHPQPSVRAQALRSVPEGWRGWPADAANALAPLLRMALFDRSTSVRHLAVLRLGEPPDVLSRWAVAEFEAAHAPWTASGAPAHGGANGGHGGGADDGAGAAGLLRGETPKTPSASAQHAPPHTAAQGASRRAAVLQLLAELGQAQSHATVQAAWHAPEASVRRSAHVAALRMGLASPAQALASALQDRAPSVYVHTWRWCRRNTLWPSRAELQALGVLDDDWRPALPTPQGAQPGQADPRVQALLASLDPWEALLVLLQSPMAADDAGDAGDARRAWHVGPASAAHKWLQAANRHGLPPTARQLGEIKALLAAGQTGAFTPNLGALRFVLQGL